MVGLRWAWVWVLAAAGAASAQAKQEERLVLFLTTDGLRWEEVFRGAQKSLIPEKDEETQREFWRETPQQRREALLPFLWGTVAKQGQIFGNRDKGSRAQVTNGKNFSYPGYNELLAGFADARIDSNDKVPNANVTVLEWLNKRPGFEGRVAAFGSWDCLPFIINRERSGLFIQAGFEPIPGERLTDRQAMFNELLRDVEGPYTGSCLDGFTFHAALDYLKTRKPRVMYVMFGETDEWAHDNKYGPYLRAARRFDRFVKALWEAAQAIAPGRVALLLTTDHGRGDGPKWTSHGKDIGGAENIWLAAMGAGVAAKGERARAEPVTQSQAAATAAALAGEDYAGAVKAAAPPIKLQ
jgi:hypothetical protein